MLWIVTAAGCGGGDLVLPAGSGPAQLLMVHGDHQQAPAGRPVDDSLVIRVADTVGKGISGQAVTWTVPIGGGQVDPETTSTDADGFAWARWILGPDPGANAARATVPGAGFVTFTAVGTTPAVTRDPVRIAAFDGDDQRAAAGSLVPIPPGVRVTDAEGDPVAGVPVSFVVTGGGGNVEGAESMTGADGIARVGSWRLGPTAGANTLEARSGSLDGSPVTFTAQGTAGAGVDHFVFRLQPHDVDVGEPFRVEVAMVDAVGNVVDLSGILIYIGLFEEGRETPVNKRLSGNRFEDTEHGVAVYDGLAVHEKGRYRIRALSDQLPQLGPHGPEPFLFSLTFQVK